MGTDRAGAREAGIIDAFVELADSLVDGYDPLDFLYHLLDHALPLVEAAAGGVLLHYNGRLHLAAASDGDCEDLELLELEHDEGPGHDAFRSGHTVAVDRLAGTVDRWPAFTRAALAAGWASAAAIPLRLRDTCIGAFVVLWPTEAQITDLRGRLLRGFADVATIAVLQRRAVTDVEIVNGQLHDALEGRIKIEQAKGIVAERTGADLADALASMRRYARSTNQRLKDVAADIIRGNLHIAPACSKGRATAG